MKISKKYLTEMILQEIESSLQQANPSITDKKSNSIDELIASLENNLQFLKDLKNKGMKEVPTGAIPAGTANLK